MKEVYLTAGEASKGIGVPAKTIIFMAQKGLTKAVDVIPPGKGGRQRRYVIKTRKFCSELGIPFVPEGGDNDEQRERKTASADGQRD